MADKTNLLHQSYQETHLIFYQVFFAVVFSAGFSLCCVAEGRVVLGEEDSGIIKMNLI